MSSKEAVGRRLRRGPAAGLGLAVLAGAILLVLPGPGSTAGGQAAEPAHLHHVHLNVADPDSTLAFYEKFFGAYRIRYRDRSPALFTERSFFLLSDVDEPAPSNLGTTLWHIGWSGVVGEAEFEWRRREGIGVQTPRTRLGDNAYMYFWGPDRELVEVYTGNRNHRFEHFHFIVTDRERTRRWFQRTLGLEGRDGGGGVLLADNVNLILTQMAGPDEERPVWYPDERYPPGRDLGTTEGTAIDHIAFSYADLDAAHERMAAAGVEIVRPPEVSAEYGHRSFFVRGPDGLLVEIVEEEPIPQAIWRSEE